MPGVDGGVGLDEVLVGVQAQAVAALGADDAEGDGLADAEGVADGQCDIADADFLRAAQGHRRQILEIDLQHGQIGFRVAANHAGEGFATILEGDDDLVGAVDHMVVGQQVAFRAHDHRRTEAGLHALLARQVIAEEPAEQRVGKQRMHRLADQFGGVQVGHRRRGIVHRVGIGHRALHAGLVLRSLAQVHRIVRQADPLGELLDDQQRQQQTGSQGPAIESQGLGHGKSLGLSGPAWPLKVVAIIETAWARNSVLGAR